MDEIFIDTWAWLALANKRDKYHSAARKSYEEIKIKGYRMVTSDYVLDETITALFRSVAFNSAVKFIEAIFLMIEKGKIRLEKVDEERFKAAWSLRKRFQDKPDISFTDFTSFVIMQELGIRKAFTGNTHFEKVKLGFEILPKIKIE